TVGKVKDLPPAGEDPLNIPKVKLWLSNTENGVMALYKVCTHLGCLYNWNTQEGKFICPCHGSEFQSDGTYIRGPAPRSLDRFKVVIENENGEVMAESDVESGAPLSIPDDPEAVIKVDTGNRINGQRHG
ncbi:MAG: hypothetical protein EHM70_08155, partial [Chloroflexota bacterium]